MPGQTLAQRVRAKYPGVYDDLSDSDLESKVKAKYPGVYDDLPTTTAKTTAPATTSTQPTAPSNTLLDRLGQFGEGMGTAMLGPGGGDVLKGLAKSGLGAVQGAGNLIRAIPVVGPLLSKADVNVPGLTAQPEGMAQTAAKAIGDVGMFMVPAASLSKAKLALATGHGVLDALVGAGLDAASASGVGAIQKGSLQGAGTTAAVTGATSLAAPLLAKGMGYLGERIEKSLIKASSADVRDGFDVANVAKYGVGGTLSQTYDKTQKQLNTWGQTLSTVLKNTDQAGKTIDLADTMNAVEQKFAQEMPKNFGQNAQIQNAITKLKDEVGLLKQPTVNISTANQVKQAVGDLGAWLHNPGGRVVQDPASNALETVSNEVYHELKSRIEQQAVGPVSTINKRLGDLMAIRRAVIRRIPIEQRQNVLNLGDFFSMLHGGVGISLANRALRSGTVANALMQGAQAPGVQTMAPPLAGAATSALTGGGQ